MAVVGAFAFAGTLTLLSSSHVPRQRLADAPAVRVALRNPAVAAAVRGHSHVRTEVRALDRRLTRVDVIDGQRLLYSVAVAPSMTLAALEPHRPGRAEFGSRIALNPAILGLLSAIFLAATLTLPVRSLRNLDALVLAAFTATVFLLNQSFVRIAVFTAAALTLWLLARCAWTALRAPPAPGPLLVRHLASRSQAFASPRLPRIAGAALVAGFVLIAVTSTGESDVAYASIAGATEILHGTVPYGHLAQGLVHGDTYPFLAYASYIPAALIMPVHDAFDDLTGALLVTTAAALVGAWAAWRRDGEPLDAVRWLAFPPMLVAASAGVNDLVTAAAVSGALAVSAAPARSTGLLAFAAWTKFAPAIALPVWLARQARTELTRALAAAVGVSAGALVLLIAIGGSHSVHAMTRAVSFQLERGSPQSLWTQLASRTAQHVWQAGLVAGAAAAAFALARGWRPAAAGRGIAALCAALVLGLELGASFWTYAYVLWAFPFIAVALLPAPPRSRPSAQRVP